MSKVRYAEKISVKFILKVPDIYLVISKNLRARYTWIQLALATYLPIVHNFSQRGW